MPTEPIQTETDTQRFTARAVRVGDHIDLRAMPTQDRVGTGPLAMRIDGGGVAVLVRYGVVVLFDADKQATERFVAIVRPYVRRPTERDETESLNIVIDPAVREGIEGDTLTVSDRSIERLQVIGDVLAKSVALAVYESQAASVFDRIEPFARGLARRGRGGGGLARLQQHLGDVLLIEHEMIGRVEVDDKPDILWERHDLERLHVALHEEFEIRERKRALERKLQLVSHTAETVVGLIQGARSLRVEWYIVILIVAELLLLMLEFLR